MDIRQSRNKSILMEKALENTKKPTAMYIAKLFDVADNECVSRKTVIKEMARILYLFADNPHLERMNLKEKHKEKEIPWE